MTDPEAEVAKRVVQCGHLEAQLWTARAAAAKAQRHRGELVGLIVGALADDALTPEYRDLARRTVERIASERSAEVPPSILAGEPYQAERVPHLVGTQPLPPGGPSGTG